MITSVVLAAAVVSAFAVFDRGDVKPVVFYRFGIICVVAMTLLALVCAAVIDR